MSGKKSFKTIVLACCKNSEYNDWNENILFFQAGSLKEFGKLILRVEEERDRMVWNCSVIYPEM